MKDQEATAAGTLYIVATPIGNREDITLRALHILKSVDLILAEDTRHSKQLLTTLGIKNTMQSLHAHNEHEKSQSIINQLLEGQSIALISDAGTPLISDPGFPLVRLAHEKNVPVVPIPGPCALIAALSAAGIACDSFLFTGFLPAKHHARQAKLHVLAAQPHTVILYESTHRIVACLEDIKAIYGADSPIVVAKELTKTFERFVSGSIMDAMNWLLAEPEHIKGEFVVIIPPRVISDATHEYENMLSILLEELPLKQAVSIACRLTEGNKNELYNLALQLKQKMDLD